MYTHIVTVILRCIVFSSVHFKQNMCVYTYYGVLRLLSVIVNVQVLLFCFFVML